MKNTIQMFVAVVCMSIMACQAPAPQEAPAIDMAALRAEVQAMEDAYAKGSNEKKPELILSYYASDAQRLPDGEPMIKGMEAITKYVNDNMASDTSGNKVRFEVLDLWAEGNLVVEVGRGISTAPDGKESYEKYVSIFERRDGKLVCVRDIWNEDSDEDDDAGGDD